VTLGGARGRALRLLVGLAISALFLVATVSRVDLAEVGAALQRVNFGALALAIPLVFVELVLRGMRWARLLAPMAPISVSRSVAYLAIGYFANSMLPARLGDVARAYLAGRSFGISRLGVLGTVVVERAADGLFILALVAVLGISVAGGGSLATTATWLAAIAAVGGIAMLGAIAYLRGSSGGRIRSGVRSLLDRVLRGTDALRSPAGFATVAALTVAAFAPAVAMFAVIAGAAGVQLSLAQAALVMGGLALSTSIPAAPGSIGTYEFVGLTIMTTLGIDAEVALAVVVLVHMVATLPVALSGMLAAWHLHFRVSEIADDAEPGRLAQDDLPGAPAGADR
jgi:glycosyltransferase 2 family protein